MFTALACYTYDMKHIVSAIVVCTLSTSAGYFIGSNIVSHEPVSVVHMPEVRTHASYVNNRLGFSFSVSPLWNNYFFVERITDRAFVVDVYIPVSDATKLAQFTDAEQRNGGVLIESVLHMSEEQYDAETIECESFEDSPCFSPTEYARGGGFVLATENPNIHAGWDYCSELDMYDEEVCQVREADWIDGKSVIGRTLYLNVH